ncbi:MAG: nuclear transport factor 2 family protein [Pirellulales bacterium]
MIRRIHSLLLAGLIATVCAAPARAEDAAASPEQRERASQVRTAAEKLLNAKQRGDWRQVAELWTPEGSYVDAAGRKFKARELANRQGPAAPGGKTTDLHVHDEIRFVTPDVAILEGLQPTEVQPDGAVQSVRFLAIWVERDGKWLLDTLREAAVTSPAPHERLEPLAWLLGEWTASTKEADVLLSTHWSASGAYMLRDFLVRSADGALTSGTQRIGWDAAAGEIKSWTFDSAGVVSQATWRQDGKQWIAAGEETLPDGARVQTKTTYAPQSDDRIRATIERTEGEAPLPKLQLEFRRAQEN